MKEMKLDGNYEVKIFTKSCEDQYLELRRSKAVKDAGLDTLRYLQLTPEKTVLVLVKKEGDVETPIGYASILLLDDKDYQRAVSSYFGIEINAKYFVAEFVIAREYRRTGIGRTFMKYIIEQFCNNESLMMHPNEDDTLFWHSVGFAFVGTDRKCGMRIN